MPFSEMLVGEFDPEACKTKPSKPSSVFPGQVGWEAARKIGNAGLNGRTWRYPAGLHDRGEHDFRARHCNR
jgi:hypothetical protein